MRVTSNAIELYMFVINRTKVTKAIGALSILLFTTLQIWYCFGHMISLTKIPQTSAMHKVTTTSVNVNALSLCKFCFTSDVRHLRLL